jgi:hypothetical protein
MYGFKYLKITADDEDIDTVPTSLLTRFFDGGVDGI